jgi:hypothetical protein
MTNLRVLLVPALLAALTLLPAAVPPAGAKEPAKASAAAPAREADIAVLRDAIRTNKKALVAASLDLSDAEKAKFWPIYESYQKELTAVHDRYLKVIDDYTKSFATLTDEHAKQLLDEWLTADADRVKLRRDYVPKFAEVLSGRKLARFYQIENKMDAVVRYDLAATIPVVQ